MGKRCIIDEEEARSVGINLALFANRLPSKCVTICESLASSESPAPCLSPPILSPAPSIGQSPSKASCLSSSPASSITRAPTKKFRPQVHNYYLLTDHWSEKLLRTAGHIRKRSQTCKIVVENKCFIAVANLSTTRIFGEHKSTYTEIKRIPSRCITISSNIITSLHHTDSKLFIAHLWGNNNNGEPRKAYIETRDFDGNIIDKSVTFDSVVKSIYSDDKHIYLKIGDSSIQAHLKGHFNSLYYVIDFSTITHQPIIHAFIHLPQYQSRTVLPIVSVTRKSILVTQYEIFDHRLVDSIIFDDELHIISLQRLESIFIILRNRDIDADSGSVFKSKIEFGYLDQDKYLFFHDCSIGFTYHIVQVETYDKYLYLLAYREKANGVKSYELAMMKLSSMEPFMITYVGDFEEDCFMELHERNVTFITQNQRLKHIRTTMNYLNRCNKCNLKFPYKEDESVHLENDHMSLFQSFRIFKNKFLTDEDVSLFRHRCDIKRIKKNKDI